MLNLRNPPRTLGLGNLPVTQTLVLRNLTETLLLRAKPLVLWNQTLVFQSLDKTLGAGGPRRRPLPRVRLRGPRPFGGVNTPPIRGAVRRCEPAPAVVVGGY
jgi:hypothetical protein